jgi:hypothetical protein
MYAPFPFLDRDKQPKGRGVGYSAFPMLKSGNPHATRVSSEPGYFTPLRPVFSENLWSAGEAAAAQGGSTVLCEDG